MFRTNIPYTGSVHVPLDCNRSASALVGMEWFHTLDIVYTLDHTCFAVFDTTDIRELVVCVVVIHPDRGDDSRVLPFVCEMAVNNIAAINCYTRTINNDGTTNHVVVC